MQAELVIVVAVVVDPGVVVDGIEVVVVAKRVVLLLVAVVLLVDVVGNVIPGGSGLVQFLTFPDTRSTANLPNPTYSNKKQ